MLEFGLRRAQGVDGAIAASRAAYIGGCSATSNVLAGKRYGIPVRGTHAHSWVMSFDSELEAFSMYASVMPNNCVFLVDTYDTLEGVRLAISVGQSMRAAGHKMVGIRLDSGDLAWLSIEARRLLNEAGFPDAVIVASNDLDERLIQSLKHQEAAIGVWGVGTKLVTAYDQPALGGVYKLGAIRSTKGDWQPKIKLSEQPIKTSTPGILQVRRFFASEGSPICDAIYNELQSQTQPFEVVAMGDSFDRRILPRDALFEDLLTATIRNGKIQGEAQPLSAIRDRTLKQLQRFHERYLRFDNPERFPVGLEGQLHDLKDQFMMDMKQKRSAKEANG